MPKKLRDKANSKGYSPSDSVDPIGIPRNDPIPNVWIPYGGKNSTQPFHCQIHRDSFPYSTLQVNDGIDHRLIIGLRWFAALDQCESNKITFNKKYGDMFGLPQITFHYKYTTDDIQRLDWALKHQQLVAS